MEPAHRTVKGVTDPFDLQSLFGEIPGLAEHRRDTRRAVGAHCVVVFTVAAVVLVAVSTLCDAFAPDWSVVAVALCAVPGALLAHHVAERVQPWPAEASLGAATRVLGDWPLAALDLCVWRDQQSSSQDTLASLALEAVDAANAVASTRCDYADLAPVLVQLGTDLRAASAAFRSGELTDAATAVQSARVELWSIRLRVTTAVEERLRDPRTP